ncbi:efflux RND transporter periplasmic adaptor subunit [Pontibacter qinzhouensis]|uniref:Efflux RND transporter periplasmic adaptor subunit n=1 Tax=Pontibacter qinzhouensis TaxID=2603253 RepID=A0A5C8IVA2_9BACT|nr:efflux RND transporter periplasmic adaptor subunit [Pontibacter qinzhouensis]TXK25016.1 efflux RND transporter periplasmic adaptor subunit [Pontibacter qinzhouensis]
MKRVNYTVLASFLCLSIACTSQTAETAKEAPATGTALAATAADVVQLSPEQQQISGITVGELEKRSLSARIQANGQVELPPQNKASINPLMGGVVRSILVKDGQYVAKGKVLATLENPDLIRLQEDYLTTLSQLSLAELDQERQQILNQEQIGARKRFEQAETDVKVQRARLNSLRTHLQSLGLSPKRVEAGQVTATMAIVAPISGYVQQIGINLGSYAQPGQEMFTLVDNSHLHLQLLVFEKDFGQVAEGQQVLFNVPNAGAGAMEATIFSLGKAFEGDSRMVNVHAEILQNEQTKILPGMYVNAQILAGKHELMAVPEEAVVRYKNKNYIFVQDAPTSFRMVAVETGVTEAGYSEIKSVAEAGADKKVVLEGAFYLLAEKMKSEVAE